MFDVKTDAASICSKYGVYLLNILYEHRDNPYFDLFDAMVHVWLETDKILTDYPTRDETNLLSYDKLYEEYRKGRWEPGGPVELAFTDPEGVDFCLYIAAYSNNQQYAMSKQLTKEVMLGDHTPGVIEKIKKGALGDDIPALWGAFFLVSNLVSVQQRGHLITNLHNAEFSSTKRILFNIYRMNGPSHLAIRQHYGERVADRSEMPLINHIEEGLSILYALGAGWFTREAWCLHPIVQDGGEAPYANITAQMYAKEYALFANAYLCTPETDHIQSEHDIQPHFDSLGIGKMSREVALMLYADKIQNQKDFRLYHRDTHPRSEQLSNYFHYWTMFLQKYLGLTEVI